MCIRDRFGSVYGSVFGLEHLLDPFYINVLGLPSKPVEVFNPETTNTLLLISVGIGVFLIVLSIIINIILGLRSKNIEGSFWEQRHCRAGILCFCHLCRGAPYDLQRQRAKPMVYYFLYCHSIAADLFTRTFSQTCKKAKGYQTG